MLDPFANPRAPELASAFETMRQHFSGLLDQNLAELYGVSAPEELADKTVEMFEIASGDEALRGGLMRVWFAAHATIQAQRNNVRKGLNGSEAGQKVILSHHRQLGIPEAPRLFRAIPGAKDRNPHQQMLALLRTAKGEKITHSRGTTHAAQILVGAVVLTQPDGPYYSMEHPDPKVRRQVAATLLR